MKALSPRTEKLYRQVLARAYPVLKGKVLSGFGDLALNLPQGAPRGLEAWPETSRMILRAAIQRTFEDAGQGERGKALVRLIPAAYRVKKQVRQPTLDEMQVFEVCARKMKGAQRTLILLTLRLGFRSVEVLNLDREDVERALETGELIFIKKGGAERVLPCDHVSELLKEALALPKAARHGAIDVAAEVKAARRGAAITWHLLGETLSAGSYEVQHQCLTRAIKSCARCAKVDAAKFSPHKLRHAFASRLSRRGASMQVLKEALGHASINTTQRYVHVEREELKGYLK